MDIDTILTIVCLVVVGLPLLAGTITSFADAFEAKRRFIEKKENDQIETYKTLCVEAEQSRQQSEQARQDAEKTKQHYIEKERKLELERDRIIAAAEREAKEKATQILRNMLMLNEKVGDHADPIRAALYEECRNQAKRLLENVDPSRIRNATSTDLEVIRVQINLESSLSATIRSGNKTYETTLHGCKCPDSDIRKKLCKHTIFLAHATGVFETIPAEAFEKALGDPPQDP